jgi:hypothetical protein
MKLFFAVLFAFLSAGLISWMTLSMEKVVHHRNLAAQRSQETTGQSGH